MVRDFSYRLTKLHEKLLTDYLRWRLQGRVTKLLADYRSRNIPFGAARDALCRFMQELATIAYDEPRIK